LWWPCLVWVGKTTSPLLILATRGKWTQFNPEGPILKPELPWERRCIEAAAMARHDGRLHMFYAGGYNNESQQIGVAGGTIIEKKGNR
ncbi:MAG: hypothetical protein N2V77_05240, partial [Canidatus Methanoxibalbensis ujae]|nr:hypothetical protein [Candidatus Methanoxibalbensis ujae]